MVFVKLQEFTVTCNVSGDMPIKNHLITNFSRYSKYQTKQLHAHTLTFAHTIVRQLVLDWVTSREYHLCLRMAYMN